MNSPDPVPQPQAPVIPPAPWYTSDVQVRLVVALGAQLVSIVFRTLELAGVHIHIEQTNLDAIVANITQGVAVVFGVLAIVKRQQSPVAPLTLTKKAADQKAIDNPPVLPVDPTK